MGTELLVLEVVGREVEVSVEAVLSDDQGPETEYAQERANHRARRPSSPLEAFIVTLVGIGVPVCLGLLVVLGFAGGTVPVLGSQLSGGFGSGLRLLAFLAAAPAVLLLAALLLSGAFRRLSSGRGIAPEAPAPSRAGVRIG
ncbi:MAG: hypothetical protein ACRDV9_00420 [Acidimicrobiia bacterium]